MKKRRKGCKQDERGWAPCAAIKLPFTSFLGCWPAPPSLAGQQLADVRVL